MYLQFSNDEISSKITLLFMVMTLVGETVKGAGSRKSEVGVGSWTGEDSGLFHVCIYIQLIQMYEVSCFTISYFGFIRT
jgi:hypothetical protein